MKLRQLLKAHFDTNGVTQMGSGIEDYILNPTLLKVYQEELSECSEFGGANIEIIENVVSGKPKRILKGHTEEGIPMYGIEIDTTSENGETIVSAKLGPNTKFSDKVKIYSISLTPTQWDPMDLLKGDEIKLSPTFYDPSTYTPLRYIIVPFSPEQSQDAAMKTLMSELRELDKTEEKKEIVVTGDEQINLDSVKDDMETVSQEELKVKLKEAENKYIETLVEKFKDCVQNPNQYVMPGKQGIILRLTKNSLVENEIPRINKEDITLVLNKK